MRAFSRAVAFLLSASVLLLSGAGYKAVDDHVICKADCVSNKIALTFDDGPHPVYTQEILDILSEYGIRATFFIIGKNAEQYPDLVIDELSSGHELGSHTYSHRFINRLCRTEINEELTKNEKVIGDICDYKFKYMRPPGGICKDALRSISEELSYDIVLWSVDTRDWTRLDPTRIAANVSSSVSGGDIILMHDYVAGGPSTTPAALRLLIPDLLERGFEFVTLSELIDGSKQENE